MPNKDDITPEERALFRESVKGTIPLGEERPLLEKKEAPTPVDINIEKKQKVRQPNNIDLTSLPLSDHGPQPVTGEESIEYRGSGISHKDLKRLKAGEFPIQSYLDLHGATIDQARDELIRFLTKAQNQHWRCVRIVHGKGKHHGDTPILKNLVNAWLRQIPIVLAFTSAPGRDGGAGAVYVLLAH